MNQNSPFSGALAAFGLLAPLLLGCGDADFDYAPPTDAQLQQVQTVWKERDLSAPGVVLAYQDDSHAKYQLRIYEHLVEGQRHYGAVTIPKSETQSAFPVVLFADGLDQGNPRMDISAWAQREQQQLDRAIFVVPAFRGRTLVYSEVTSNAEGDSYRDLVFDAEGDFCDAYDGATDDSIALLNVVADEMPQADFSRLMVSGHSRGGNVALLLAERYDRVTVASAQSAPTDFIDRRLPIATARSIAASVLVQRERDPAGGGHTDECLTISGWQSWANKVESSVLGACHDTCSPSS